MLAGAGGYNTAEVIELAHELEGLGSDGILSVTPSADKAAQHGRCIGTGRLWWRRLVATLAAAAA